MTPAVPFHLVTARLMIYDVEVKNIIERRYNPVSREKRCYLNGARGD